MITWVKLSDLRVGDVFNDGSELVSPPVRMSNGVGMYVVRDPQGITHTDVWPWDEELMMRESGR